MEIAALGARGWSVSAIARHTGRDRKTVRRYLAGEGARGRRVRPPSCLEPFRGYVVARFGEDPHLLCSVLYRELVAAGFDRSYSTLVREVRRLGLRPVCRVCRHRAGRAPTVEIDHPAGEEIQWDWLELDHTPWGEKACVLVGALSHSGRFRAVFCEQMTFGHLAGAVHEVLVALGGTARVWRTDRMATAVIAGTDRLYPPFGQMARHYGVDVAVCPARRPQRKGVVEAAIKYLTRSWWATAAVSSPAEAQQSLERWCGQVADRRRRGKTTVGVLGAGEPLRELPPAAFVADIDVERIVSRSALVAFDGNRYSVDAAHAGQRVAVRTRVGEPTLAVFSLAGTEIAVHRLAVRGGGQTIRTSAHTAALKEAVLDAFTTDRACARKRNRPPGEQALAELARLHGQDATAGPARSLERYADLAAAGGPR